MASVAKAANWEETGMLAKELGVCCVTRTKGGGAKAGNIENARMELQLQVMHSWPYSMPTRSQNRISCSKPFRLFVTQKWAGYRPGNIMEPGQSRIALGR